MPPGRYQRSVAFSDLHRSPVVSVAFSPCGKFLATVDAGVQSNEGHTAFFVVWPLSTQNGGTSASYYALETAFGLSHVLWPADDVGVLIGGRDGTVTVVKDDKTTQMVRPCAHFYISFTACRFMCSRSLPTRHCSTTWPSAARMVCWLRRGRTA